MSNWIVEQKGAVRILCVNRPDALNALNRETVDELDGLLDAISGNTAVRAVVIGSNRHFAAGADIKDMIECNPDQAKAFAFYGTFGKLHDLPVPTIAAIDGYCLGGGLELALCCDFRIASGQAKLGLPEINLGIMPGAGGNVRLARLIGESRAKELIMLGGRITADEAGRYGLVNYVTEPETLMETAVSWGGKLAGKSPSAMRTAKQTIQAAFRMAEPDALAADAENWAALFATYDQKEGMRAFIEKRKPEYRGE